MCTCEREAEEEDRQRGGPCRKIVVVLSTNPADGTRRIAGLEELERASGDC
jgi:hypothetical protein